MYHLSLCNSFPGGMFGASLLCPSVIRHLSAMMMIAIAKAINSHSHSRSHNSGKQSSNTSL